MLTESRKEKGLSKKWIYSLSLLYLVACVWFLNQSYFWFAAMPLALGLGVYTLFRPANAFMLLVFLTPFSVRVFFDEIASSIQLPYEPFVIILSGMFLLKVLLDWKYDPKILKHAITYAIVFNLIWLLITAALSTMPAVSLKFFLSRIWFVLVFYFIAVILFKDFNRMKQFFWLYSTSLSVIVIYTVYRHSLEHFSHRYSNYAMHPFYSDHGVYAAAIAMLMPLIFAFVLKPKLLDINRWQQGLAFVISLIFIVGMYYSYTRAAWVSLAVAIGAWILFYFRVKLVTIFAYAFVIGGLLFIFRTDIMISIQQNKDVSTEDFNTHLRSVTNVSTDESNVERINRWMSAWRMFKEKPIIGWGPNTYMFQYAPFQSAFEKTSISTNRGDQGNAHSEYIGPLAEQGLLGMLSIIIIALISVNKGMNIYYKHPDHRVRIMALCITLGLITYFVHGFLNNYLDNGKAAILVWGFIAALVALDIYFKPKETVDKELR